jgi:hypothetical protein
MYINFRSAKFLVTFFFSVILTPFSAMADVQSSEEEDLAFAYYKFREAKRIVEEKGDCSHSTTSFLGVKNAYQSALRDMDEKLNQASGKTHLLETKVVALYGLAECYNQRNSRDTAVQYATETVDIIRTLLSESPTSLKNIREYIFANERLGLFAKGLSRNDVAKIAFAESVSFGEQLILIGPAEYEDYRNLIINYVRLTKVTDDPEVRVKYLKEAACVSMTISTTMPDEDKDNLIGGVLFELYDAQKLAGKPAQETVTGCKTNPNSTFKELP